MIRQIPGALRTCALSLLLMSNLHAATLRQAWQSNDCESHRIPETASQDVLRRRAASEKSQAFERLDLVNWSDWENLPQLLEDIHQRVGVPAIAAALVKDGRIVAEATVGVRVFGGQESVTATERFHLGSVTKSFTAVVVAKLIELQELSWNTTVGEVFKDMEMRAEYRDVTVEQLLRHRSGLPSYTDGRPSGHDASKQYFGSPPAQRIAFLADVLQQTPAGTAGKSTLYSNAGYTLVGAMAERVSGIAWEQLVQRFVFDPLQMKSAGFGVSQCPMGHVGFGPEFKPVPLEAYPALESMAPAGNLHCSVSDLAKYAAAHLAGLNGADGILPSQTFKHLHALPPDGGDQPYACGWKVTVGPGGERVHEHAGTVGAFFAEVKLFPDSNMATVVLTNVSRSIGEPVASHVASALVKRYRSSTTGFVTARGSGPEQLELKQAEATAKEKAAVWSLILKLSEAINEENRKAFHALFANQEDRADRDSMFDFMTHSVIPMRGGIYAFHDLSPPLVLPDSQLLLWAVTFHLENGFPGYIGLQLADEGKLEELSLFVKADVCPEGTDRSCTRIVKKLEGEI